MGFKNEEPLKQKIVDGHRRGVCDSDGNTTFKNDAHGNRIATAKPTFGAYPCSARKTFVLRNGEMVLKD